VGDKLVPLTSFDSDKDNVYITRGKLQSEGIVSFITNQRRPTLWVKESQVAKATSILNETRQKCPVCTSTDIIDVLSYLKKNSRLKCHACGYEWNAADYKTDSTL
jgi:transposase-like protein